MKGLLTMSKGERDRLRVIQAVQERRLTQAEAAQRLELSVRQIKPATIAQRLAWKSLTSRRWPSAFSWTWTVPQSAAWRLPSWLEGATLRSRSVNFVRTSVRHAGKNARSTGILTAKSAPRHANGAQTSVDRWQGPYSRVLLMLTASVLRRGRSLGLLRRVPAWIAA